MDIYIIYNILFYFLIITKITNHFNTNKLVISFKSKIMKEKYLIGVLLVIVFGKSIPVPKGQTFLPCIESIDRYSNFKGQFN